MAGSPGGSPQEDPAVTKAYFWRRLNYLIPEPQCNTRAGIITLWYDGRTQPTDNEINVVDLLLVDAAELENRALEFGQIKTAFASLLEILYENPDLTSSYANINAFKTAVKDRYKDKI